MIVQSGKLRIKPTFKNPLSEKLKEKHQNSIVRRQHFKVFSKNQRAS